MLFCYQNFSFRLSNWHDIYRLISIQWRINIRISKIHITRNKCKHTFTLGMNPVCGPILYLGDCSISRFIWRSILEPEFRTAAAYNTSVPRCTRCMQYQNSDREAPFNVSALSLCDSERCSGSRAAGGRPSPSWSWNAYIARSLQL